VLVPVAGSVDAGLITALAQPDARLVSRGYLPGSYVVSARGLPFTTLLFEHGVLVHAASPALCATTGETA